MISYSEFLGSKDQSNIWRKAKQREFYSLDQILLALEDLELFTWRNAMSLRLLGLLGKPTTDSGLAVGLTAAGTALLQVSNKQMVVDEQLLKIYLDSDVNPELNVPVFPTAIIYELLSKLKTISFEEYSLFVCWINDDDDKANALSLITQFRNSDSAERAAFHTELDRKTASLNYSNFNDNIYRLFGMFKLSSFIVAEIPNGRWSDVLLANSSAEIYNSLAKTVTQIDLNNYNQQATRFLNLVTVSPEYNDLTGEIAALSLDEQQLIKKQLVARNKLPDISVVEPKMISADFLQINAEDGKKAPQSSAKVKIDYVKRAERNGLVGNYGERIVMKYEYTKLVARGRSDLAQKVKHCSEDDDSLGYDIKSFDENGDEKHIEVKTVSGRPKNFRFYISRNELDKVENDAKHCIYLVFNYNTHAPEILEIGNLLANIESGTAKLTAVNYTVAVSLNYA